MHNFVSLAECLNSPNAACALSPPSLLLYVLIAALAVLGWRAARCGEGIPGARVRRWLFIGLMVIALSSLAVIGFFAFDPDAPLGVEKDTVAEALWLIAINAFGFGVMIMLGTAGYWLANRLAQTLPMREKDRS